MDRTRVGERLLSRTDDAWRDVGAVTSGYLKVNAAPFLWHVDLFDDIDDETATVTHEGRDDVIFRCSKRRPGIWGKLHREGDREEIMTRRAASLRARSEADDARETDALEAKKRIAREFLERQWAANDARIAQNCASSCESQAASTLKPRQTTRLRSRAHDSHRVPPPRAFITISVALTPTKRLPARQLP